MTPRLSLNKQKMTVREIGETVLAHGLGQTVDVRISAKDVDDAELAQLWMEAETALNALQLYLEEKLGTDFFNA